MHGFLENEVSPPGTGTSLLAGGAGGQSRSPLGCDPGRHHGGLGPETYTRTSGEVLEVPCSGALGEVVSRKLWILKNERKGKIPHNSTIQDKVLNASMAI